MLLVVAPLLQFTVPEQPEAVSVGLAEAGKLSGLQVTQTMFDLIDGAFGFGLTVIVVAKLESLLQAFCEHTAL
jgi:hypothetical protein